MITFGKSVRKPAMLFCTFRAYPEIILTNTDLYFED